MMTSPRSLAVVVPVLNEEAQVANCLLALITQVTPVDEIIVVDNGSTDSTVAIVQSMAARYPRVPLRLLHEPVRGLIAARNTGLDAATADVLARIDADTVADPMWSTAVVAAMRGGVAGVSGPVYYRDLPWVRFGAWLDRNRRRRFGRGSPFLVGCNMALRRSAWEQVRDDVCHDLVDLFHEDIDLAIHLRQAGLPLGYDEAMVAGVSGRRALDSRARYQDYLGRFRRTYDAHQVTAGGLLELIGWLWIGWGVTQVFDALGLAAGDRRTQRRELSHSAPTPVVAT